MFLKVMDISAERAFLFGLKNAYLLSACQSVKAVREGINESETTVIILAAIHCGGTLQVPPRSCRVG